MVTILRLLPQFHKCPYIMYVLWESKDVNDAIVGHVHVIGMKPVMLAISLKHYNHPFVMLTESTI